MQFSEEIMTERFNRKPQMNTVTQSKVKIDEFILAQKSAEFNFLLSSSKPKTFSSICWTPGKFSEKQQWE